MRRKGQADMKYIGEPNMLLEALAWLGRKAAGRSVGDLEDRLTARGIRPTKDFRERLAPLTALSRHLHAPDQETLKHLFGNLQGFAYNVIGLYSVGFLLFYPMIWEYKGDFDALLAKMESL